MFNALDVGRFTNIFEKILNNRIVPFVEEYVFDIMCSDNFTSYYKEEIYNGKTLIRPVFELSKYDLVIMCLIVNELNNPEFIKEMHLDIIPINNEVFFKWLQSYLYDHNILFHITHHDNETGEDIDIAFYCMLMLEYTKITRQGYELLL